MTARTRYVNGVVETYDDVTQEIVETTAANFFCEDFVGASHSAGFPTSATQGYPWVKKIVGAAPPTVAPVVNASGGITQLALTSTSEKQDAVLYAADARSWDMTKNAVFEVRAALTVPPSAAGVQAVWGLAANWIDGPDNNSFYVEFGCTANANLLIRTQDGVTQNSIAAAQIGGPAIALDTNQHIFRIRAVGVNGDLEFSVDGNRVSVINAVAFAAAGANAILQPYIAVYKPSGTGVATLQVDKVQMSMGR
jgi:hypothetical protein